MSRPLRDIPPSVSYTGEAARSWGRIDKGLEPLERGGAAIERGFKMLAAVAAERAEQLRRLEEETTAARAETELRRRVGEGVRNLDPSSPDYMDQVQGLFEQTVGAVAKEAQFRGEAARERFNIRAEQFRTNVILQAMDARERAALERAELEINGRLNAAAAAVVTNPTSFPLVLSQFEAEVAGMLASFDANRRDRILQTARERLATDYVRTLVANRDFNAAEAALRELGPRQLLSSTAIGALRSAMVAERRQAAAEARQERELAYRNAMLAIQEAAAIVDTGAPMKEREAAVEMARKAAEEAARKFGADSFQARRLNIMVQRLAYAARDRGAELLEGLRSRMAAGDNLTEREQAAFLNAVQAAAADQAERMLPADASPELRHQTRMDASRAAYKRGLEELVMLQRGGAKVPALEQLLDNAQRAGPEVYAEELAYWANRGYGQLPSVTAVIARDPLAQAVLDNLRAQGMPLTRDNIMAGLVTRPRPSAEERKLLEDQFERAFMRPENNSPNLRGFGRAAEELRKLDRDLVITHLDRLAVLDRAKRLFASGMSEEEAFRVAAKQHVQSSRIGLPVVTGAGKMVDDRALVDQSVNPLQLVPGEIVREYGPTAILTALAERGASLLQQVNKKIAEEKPEEALTPAMLARVRIVPTVKNGAFQYAAIFDNGKGDILTVYVGERNRPPIADRPSPEFFHETLGLRRRLEQARDAARRPITYEFSAPNTLYDAFGIRVEEQPAQPEVSITREKVEAVLGSVIELARQTYDQVVNEDRPRRPNPQRAILEAIKRMWDDRLGDMELRSPLTGRDVSALLFNDPDRRPTYEEFNRGLRRFLSGQRRDRASLPEPLLRGLYEYLYGEDGQ